jgi:GcrA cell cycle regulator
MTAHQPNQDLAWTVERIATLTRLWAAGASQGEIAALFGVTRNTIAGKIARLGLTREPGKIARLGLTREPGPRAAPRQARKHYPKKPGPKPASLPLPPEPARDERGVQLIELTNATCRWPFGSVGADDFRFCGVPTADFRGGKPYCREHTKLARRT